MNKCVQLQVVAQLYAHSARQVNFIFIAYLYSLKLCIRTHTFMLLILILLFELFATAIALHCIYSERETNRKLSLFLITFLQYAV